MNKKVLIAICSVIAPVSFGVLGFLVCEFDLFDNLFSPNRDEVVLVTNGKKEVIKKNKSNKTAHSKSENRFKMPKLGIFGPKVNIEKSKASKVEFVPYNNGLFSAQIPKGWTVGVGKTDYMSFTFMIYDTQNPDYKIFFNMKSAGYLKTRQMKAMYAKYYPTSPFAKLPVIAPQTTENFYKNFTQAFAFNQKALPFKVPVIKNFKALQKLGKNQTGGAIVRGLYQNEQGKNIEGIFTATIKEFAMPPVVMLIVYNTVFFTAPENELVDWIPVLNHTLSTIKFSDSFISAYYKEQGQVVQNAGALQSILNQTSNIITSGWSERQKTYDIISQKQSDATLGYDRIRSTETGDIYKVDISLSDTDWHGRFEAITDDMYTLPVAGYIEKR